MLRRSGIALPSLAQRLPAGTVAQPGCSRCWRTRDRIAAWVLPLITPTAATALALRLPRLSNGTVASS